MTDRGSFKVQADKLRTHAGVWKDYADNVKAAAELIAPGVGMGYQFGYLAGSCGVESSYNTWSEAMQTALSDAETNFRYLEAALTSTANDYDGVDSTVATDFSKLDGMI